MYFLVTSIYHLIIKFYIEAEVAIVKGDQRRCGRCYSSAIRKPLLYWASYINTIMGEVR